MNEKFIYAVIENNAEDPPLPVYDTGGIDGAPLEIVPYRDLAAVISSIDIKRFDESEDSSGRKQECLQADMLCYQLVNRFLLEHSRYSGMLPLRFGFTAKDKEQVEEVLRRIYIQLRTFLNRLKGKVELVVQVVWNLQKILEDIGNDRRCIETKTNSPDPVGVGRILFEAAEVRRRKFIASIHHRLSPLAKDFSEGPRKAEAMIMNRSYLVENESEALFDEAVNFLASQEEGYLTFRYIGPLPAYSFVNVELNRGNFAMVDRARKTLGLPEKASLDEIKASYRNLLLSHHPDRNPDSPRAEEQCKEVIEAYKILVAYCRSVQGGMTLYSFAKDEIERVFIVRDARSHRAMARAASSEELWY